MSPTPLELLLAGRYKELFERLCLPGGRGQLLAQVAGALGPLPGIEGGAAALRQRQLDMFAAGDWSWGILTPRQRREFLLRDARLLSGGGSADDGAAQMAALKRLKAELGNLYESLDLALADGDLAWLLPLAEHLASILEITSEFASMQERYSAMLAAALRLGSARLELHSRLGLSSALTSLGRYGEAQSEAAAAAGLAAQLSDDKLRAAALHLGGSACALAGGYSEARALLTQALELRRALGERHGVVATMSNLAYVEEYTGQRSASLALLTEALGLCRELGDRRGEAMFLHNIATVECNAGNYEAARDLGGQALAIHRALGERRGEAGALSAIGYAEYGAGNFAAAKALHLAAVGIARALGDRYGESASLLALGALDLLLGADAEAGAHYAQALAICQGSGDRQGEARALCGQAITAGQPSLAAGAGAQGRAPSQAAERLSQALTIFGAIGEPPGIADCLVYGAWLILEALSRPGQSSPASGVETAAALAHTAGRALSGARRHAALLQHHFDPLDLRLLESAEGRLQSLAETGVLPRAEPGGPVVAEGDLGLSELAALVCAALAALSDAGA